MQQPCSKMAVDRAQGRRAAARTCAKFLRDFHALRRHSVEAFAKAFHAVIVAREVSASSHDVATAAQIEPEVQSGNADGARGVGG